MRRQAISILYLGKSGEHTTSEHRAHALRRLGHTVFHVDPFIYGSHKLTARLANKLHFRTGYRLLQKKVFAHVSEELLRHSSTQLVWVDGGELIGPKCLDLFNQQQLQCVLFNHDDPTGKRDGRRFDMVKKSLPMYDLSVAVRKESLSEYRALGAKNAFLAWRSYDEIAHRPFPKNDEIPVEYRSDVAFIGTWMAGEHRDRFLLSLMYSGINVSIWGDRWDRSPIWNELKLAWRGSGLGGRNYVAAIQGAKLCLGMLSRQNRDHHTTRSMEIPFAGGLLCAERTDEHRSLYEEDREAVFWSDAEECIAKCKWLLSDLDARESIRVAGMRRVRKNHVGNEDLCRSILEQIGIQSPKVADAQVTD